MKFDVIIGNPPYQEMDNESGKGSAKPLYHYFIKEAINLKPSYLSLITPNVWFTGGKGLDHFRTEMLNNIHFKKFVVFHTPRDVFPNVSLRGGVNYFLWDSDFDNQNQVSVINIENMKTSDSAKRIFNIKELNLFIPSNISISILEKLIDQNAISTDYENEKVLTSYISPRNPFDFSTTFKRFKKYSENSKNLINPVKIYESRGKTGFVEYDEITKNKDLINSIKVITAFANNLGTDLNDDNLNTLIVESGAIVTETYLIIGIGIIDSLEKAKNLSKYLKSKFVRFLISIAKANQNGTRTTYRFVPVQSFSSNSDITWTTDRVNLDKQLYNKYKLSKEQIDFIETNIKEMD